MVFAFKDEQLLTAYGFRHPRIVNEELFIQGVLLCEHRWHQKLITGVIKAKCGNNYSIFHLYVINKYKTLNSSVVHVYLNMNRPTYKNIWSKLLTFLMTSFRSFTNYKFSVYMTLINFIYANLFSALNQNVSNFFQKIFQNNFQVHCSFHNNPFNNYNLLFFFINVFFCM